MVNRMVYSLADIQSKIAPIAISYKLSGVYLFGSYARNEASEDSDIDLIIDEDKSHMLRGLDMISLQLDLEQALGKKVSLVTVESLESQLSEERWRFVRNAVKEAICIYERP